MKFGKYELLDAIGKGSIAEVFKAKSFGAEGFEKLLVIKRIEKKFSEDEIFSKKFVQETQEALLLNHTNIVQVFDLGKVENHYYLAMELVQGLSLASMVKLCRLRGRVPPFALSAFIAAEMAKGLDFAHRKRGRNLQPLDIVHRDLTAANILISAEGEVKISDFGLAGAKEAVQDILPPDPRPLYLSPEQAEGTAPDRRSDVFSVGVMLYELTAGSHPFAGISREDLPESVREQKFDAPETFLSKDTEKELGGIIARALAPNPADRFSDAGAMYEALISYIYHTGVRAGAHSVADFLKEIAEEEISVTYYHPLKAEALDAAFRASIPPESEADKAGTRRPLFVSSEPPPDISIDSTKRDTAILAVDLKSASVEDFNTAQFKEIIENNGGMTIRSEGNRVAAVFGLDLAYGRETEEALDAAFKIRRAAVVHNPTQGPQITVAVLPATITITGEEALPTDCPDCAQALKRAEEAAGRAEEGVVTSAAGRKLSGGAYHFEALDADALSAKRPSLFYVIGRVPLTESYGRLFGRHENLRAVGAVFSEASAGKGGVLVVQGPAGIGKTRLIREGQWRLLSSGGDVGWFETVCDERSRARPFSAVASLFRSITALEIVEPHAEIKEKTGRLRELSLTADEAEAVSALLGAPPSRDETYYLDAKRVYYAAAAHLAAGLSKERPTVFVFDNADDIDTDSFEILRRLTEILDTLPLILCLIYRNAPEAILSCKAVRTIEVIPLSKANTAQAAAAAMDAEQIDPALSDHIFKVTRGNPSFVEAYARSMVQNRTAGVQDKKAVLTAEVDVAKAPRRVEEALAETIAALSEEERTMLECAAMLGRTFNVKLQKPMLGRDVKMLRSLLSSLKKKRLIYRSSADEFTFASALFRDAVAAAISKEALPGLHRKVVRAMEKVFEGRMEDVAAEAAMHCEAAGDIVAAVEYCTVAGKKAAELNADRTALDFYIKALELLQSLPEPPPEGILAVCLPIGRLAVRANAYELGLEKIQAAEWIAEEVTDKETLIRILLLTSELHAHCEHIVEVDWYMEWAMDLAGRLDDRGLSFDVLEAAGHVYFLIGDMKQAAPRFREAIELARNDAETDKDQLITCMAQLAKVEAAAGELEQAVITLAEAETLLSDDSDLLARCEIEQSKGRAFFMAGNFDKSLNSQLHLLEIAKEYGLNDHVADATHMLGTLHLEAGDLAKAFAYLTMSKETAEEIGMKHLGSINSLLLRYIDVVELSEDADQVDDLEKLLLEALERDAVWEQLHLLYYLSRIYLEKGQRSLAKEHLEQLVKLGGKVNNRLYHNKAEELLKEIRVFEKLAL